jgi:uncharacterized protein (TIGR02145 family)
MGEIMLPLSDLRVVISDRPGHQVVTIMFLLIILYGTFLVFAENTSVDTVADIDGNVCPAGWVLPREEEWLDLISHMGGEAVAGENLARAGFNITFTGWFDFTGEYKGHGKKTFLRSSTSPRGRGGYARELNNTGTSCTRVFLHPDDAIAIRCVKDQ